MLLIRGFLTLKFVNDIDKYATEYSGEDGADEDCYLAGVAQMHRGFSIVCPVDITASL